MAKIKYPKEIEQRENRHLFKKVALVIRLCPQCGKNKVIERVMNEIERKLVEERKTDKRKK